MLAGSYRVGSYEVRPYAGREEGVRAKKLGRRIQ